LPPDFDRTSDASPVAVVEPSDGRASGRVVRIFILLAGFIGLASCLIFPFPMQGRHWAALFDLAHAPAFFLVFLGIAGTLDPAAIGLGGCWRPYIRLSLRTLILLSVILCLVGAAGELLQGLVSRSPSLMDVAANCIGLLAAMFWCVSRRLKQSHFRWMLSLIAPALLFAVSVPPLRELRECGVQRQEFPLLASFERAQELTAWFPHQATATFVSDWASHGTQSMRIQGKTKRRFPGATLIWPISDWTGYGQLQLDVFNPQETELVIGINIGDRNHAETGHEPSNRYQQSFNVPPSTVLTITIALHEVASAPVTRLMNMSEIAMLDLYMPDAGQPTILFVDNIRLTK